MEMALVLRKNGKGVGEERAEFSGT